MATQNLGRVVGSKIYTGNANSHTEIQTQLTGQAVVPLIYDLYISTTSNIFQYQLVEGNPTWALLMNIKGDAGTFSISKVYASVAAMEAGYGTDGLAVGALVVINTGSVEDEDNAKLFVKGAARYEYLTDMSGAAGIQGPKGDTGATGDKGAAGSIFTPSVSEAGVLSWTNNGNLTNPASVNIKGDAGRAAGFGMPTATVTTLEAGSSATVDIAASGEDTAKVFGFSFGIPKSERGGSVFYSTAASASRTSRDTLTPSTDRVEPQIGDLVMYSNGDFREVTDVAPGATYIETLEVLANIKGPKGDTGATGPAGATGPQGANGADGKTPTLAINSAGELVATYEDEE